MQVPEGGVMIKKDASSRRPLKQLRLATPSPAQSGNNQQSPCTPCLAPSAGTGNSPVMPQALPFLPLHAASVAPGRHSEAGMCGRHDGLQAAAQHRSHQELQRSADLHALPPSEADLQRHADGSKRPYQQQQDSTSHPSSISTLRPSMSRTVTM